MIRPETESKYKSYIGKRFGKLIIKDFIYISDNEQYFNKFKFLCDCDCGATKVINCRSIIDNKTISCGCLKTVHAKNRYDQYVGKKINHLTIKKFIYDQSLDGNFKYQFLCDCDCGTKDKLIQCSNIVVGDQKSCGCINTTSAEEKYKSYIGTKHGLLTIKDYIYNDQKLNTNKYQFLCDCDCGTKDVMIDCAVILYNNKLSCGCLNSGIRPETDIKYKSYIGTKQGFLTIKDFVYDPDANKRSEGYRFLCDCDCGTKDKLINASNIISKNQQSCGCIINGIRPETEEMYRSFIGTKINKLTIKDFIYNPDGINQQEKFNFLCDCDCGTNDKLIGCFSILNQNQQSCGCFNSITAAYEEKLSEHCKENNLQLLDQFKSIKKSVLNNNGKISAANMHYTYRCTKCNSTFMQSTYILPICPKCNPNCVSRAELIISNFLLTNNIIFKKGMIDSVSDIQNRVEIDFNLIEYNVGLELHGLVTHASSCNYDLLNDMFVAKPAKYHLNKLESATTQNIDLLQFWNTEVYQKPEIVKSIILNRLNRTEYSAYARDCYVSVIDKHISDEFLISNHIQGTVANDTIRLGLFYKKNNNLVSVMTFGSSRFSEHQWELYRFATILNSRVVGGASKLFKHFIRNYNPVSIVSYSDRRLFNNGKLYESLNFKLDHVSEPNYWYFKQTDSEQTAQLHHRVKFQKHKLYNVLESFDPKLTEWQNMENNGYLRVYDCGNKVYHW
jgi:hypothetical protein